MGRRGEKAAARVAQEIVHTIYTERLAPGSRYLGEADALVRHQVSRATFREALRFLEFQGVVRVRAGPGGGAIVRKPDWPNLTSTFALLLQFADAPLRDVMVARTVLEPPMAALAAQNATPEDLARIEAFLETAQKSLGDAQAFLDAYREFWAAVAAATRNAVTSLLWPALRALVDSAGFVPHEAYREFLLQRMSALVVALRARDAERAQVTVAEMDRAFVNGLNKSFPKRASQPIAWSDVLD